MKKSIKSLLNLFRRKPATQEAFDIDPETSKKIKEIFGTDHKFAELAIYEEDSREKIEKLLETIEEDPDRL
tara:strand:+ start:787 stop:999 length:213 start_codon:yes stop_codon:yes gene_type:complete